MRFFVSHETQKNGWLNKTISKLTQAFTAQMPRLVTDYSVCLSENISNLRLELADLKKRNRVAEAHIESNLKANIDKLLEILGPQVCQSQAFIFIACACNNKQMIKLQQVNKRFYKRISEWMKTVIVYPAIRLSEIVCPDTISTEWLFFPT